MDHDKTIALYDHPAAMQPLLPEGDNKELRELSLKLVQDSARLGNSLNPVTRQSIAALLRSMNSYYSNLIEGHNTHPADIERALRRDFSSDPAKRALQLESKAHVEVQEQLERQLIETPDLDVCSPEFLCGIHQAFYAQLPPEFRVVKTRTGKEELVVPGELRQAEVEVGRHIGPRSQSLPRFLQHFQAAYKPSTLDPLQRVIAVAASHHRFTWIHPFLDGNGRVVRLFSHAFLIRIGVADQGLWTVSRGLARRREAYISALSKADARRWNDYDGRGNLSNAALIDFCRFFLEMCVDQVQFMSALLDLDSMQQRIAYVGQRWAALHHLKHDLVPLLRDCFLRGELSRSEAAHVLRSPERTSRRLLGTILQSQLLVSEGPGKPVRLGFPIEVVGYYFPKLFPESVEIDSRLLQR